MNRHTEKHKFYISLIIALIAVSIAVTPVVSQAALGEPTLEEIQEWDPWEPFNSRMFWFNHAVLDRYIVKPVARAWNFVLPDTVQRSVRNAVDNTNMPSRMLNSLAQGKFGGAGRELARFTINTTIGIGGLFDVATGFGIDRSDVDTGQTLGVYGVGPGPYLVLPFLSPTVVRDGFGTIVDGAMNPLNYILPFAAGASGGTTTATLAGVRATNTVNQRSMNLELFEGVEETAIDLYSAVRNAYLQQREAKIRKAKIE